MRRSASCAVMSRNSPRTATRRTRERKASIGASTMVFGALGVLTAYQFAMRKRMQFNLARTIGPILGGVVLLSMMGFGESRAGKVIDYTAHLTGFATGALIGIVHGTWTDPAAVKKSTQLVFLVSVPVLFLVSWILAIRF